MLQYIYITITPYVISHSTDPQNEYLSRQGFLWQMKFKVEREEVSTMESLNKVLLENVLPAHVADHFMKQRMKSQVRAQIVSL